MEALLKIIKSYSIFTTLYPGYLFVVFCEENIQNYIIALHEKSIFLGVCVCYFIGTLINRIGSLVVEKILQKINFLNFAEYGDFIEAANKDEKIDVLSQTNNMYRSMVAVFLVLIIMRVLPIDVLEFIEKWFVCILFVVFLLSYRKQTEYVVKRVKKTLDNGK